MPSKTDTFGMLAALVVTLVSAPGWFYDLYYSASHQKWFMFTVDFVLPPIGVVHGWGAIIGVW
jgi:hypothetical protein